MLTLRIYLFDHNSILFLDTHTHTHTIRADKTAKFLRKQDRPQNLQKFRQIVPAKRHLILVRSRLQLEFKLGCRGRVTSSRANSVRLPLVTKLRYLTVGIFNPEDPCWPPGESIKGKSSSRLHLPPFVPVRPVSPRVTIAPLKRAAA